MLANWVDARVCSESLLIPDDAPVPGDRQAQRLFRTLFEWKRSEDLAVHGRLSRARLALDWAAEAVRRKYPGFRPFVHAELLRR